MDPFKDLQNEELDQGVRENRLPQPYLQSHRKIDADQLGNPLLDLSPFRIINPFSLHSAGKLNNTDMALIETPANNIRNSYLDQIDEGEKMKQIAKVLKWDNGEDIELEDADSQSYEEIEESDNESDVPEPQYNQQRRWVVESTVRQNPEENKEIFQEKTPSVTDTREKVKKIPVSSTSVKKTITCNCKKTQCLKLYCDCFRDNEICGQGCNCQGCYNTTQNEYKRRKIMLELRQRNPQAFKPKIIQEQHSKGCQCKKSHCQKKYCECYQAGLKCGHNCKCEECKNTKVNLCSHEEENNLRTAVKREKKSQFI